MQSRDVVGSWIHAHPRASVRIFIFTIFFVWQSVPAFIGGIIFTVLYWNKWVKPLPMLVLGVLTACLCLILEDFHHHWANIANILNAAWELNLVFWLEMIQGNYRDGIISLFKNGANFILGLPGLIAGLLLTIEYIYINPHKKVMSALHQGIPIENAEVSVNVLNSKMNQLPNRHTDGTVLGVSTQNGKPIILSDHDVNHIVLVLGTTGGGKTITLRRFYDRAITEGYPLIIVDGKPSDENVAWIKEKAQRERRMFYGFNCDNHDHYDPLAHGGYTELKDKIISLKDQWENDYYRSIAEDYLQTTLQVLVKSGQPYDLAEIVKCLNLEDLAALVRTTKDKKLVDRVKELARYDRKDITGLQAHLNLLINSELGDYFKVNEKSFNLSGIIQQNAVVYFALPALRFPSFSKVLGKLVINDLKAVIDRQAGDKRVFMIFDEFSVFAGEQVLNLVNMGRGKGVHAIFGTQGLADLDKVDVAFKSQLLNCANTLICHRLNDHASAESISMWAGTKDAFNITTQLNINAGEAEMGTVKNIKEFILHPDDIKQTLTTGEAFMVSKLNGFRKEKIKVKYS
jgi:hypothetical protein